MYFNKFFVIALALLGSNTAQAEGKATSLPHEKYSLGNGLEVILHHDDALPIVAVNVWYHAGPLNEPAGRTGFAHLFEHLMFQGSKNVGDEKHFEYLSGAGASRINGTTDHDRTNYFETVPSNQLELALWLESDRMGFLLDALTQAKLDNQRDVVQNERRQSVENVPYGPSSEKLVQTLFPKTHPYYGNVIGSMADLQAASLQDVKDFFIRYYTPANATLVIAGDFDPKGAKALVQRYFGTIRGGPKPETPSVDTPAITKERRVVVEEPVNLARLQMAWLTPSFYAEGDAEADIAAFVLGAGKSSRMYQRLVRELELAQNVRVAQESLALRSVFRVIVTARPGVSVKKLEAETQRVLDELKSGIVSETEIRRARNMLTMSTVRSLQDIGNRANTLNRYNQYLGKPDFLAEDLARYDRVTPEAVKAFANSYLHSNGRVVVLTQPAPPAPKPGS